MICNFSNLMSIVCCIMAIVSLRVASERPMQKKITDMKMIAIHLPDYCPTMPSCRKGVHIVCVYDPYFQSRLGPKCDGGKNITLTEVHKNKILGSINFIRGRVAEGVETGKDNVPLVRAYNMRQLDWDTHLAAFAQILANQCTFKHDMCRATINFPDPGQTIGVMRFTYPDWKSVEPNGPLATFAGFDDRVEYAIQHIIRRWYRQKGNVTNEMISRIPVRSRRQYLRDMTECSVYLQLVAGKATHVGCGMSAYTDYAHSAKERYYNMIHLVCNFSYKPQLNEFVYEIHNENNNKCGCENDMGHSGNCLCHPYYLRSEEPVKEPDAPVIEEPVTEELVTEAPVTEELVTEAPVTEEPVTEQLVTEAPVTEELVTEELLTEAPVTEELVSEELVTEAPVTEELVSEELVTEAPVTEEPVTEELIYEKPITEELVYEEPITEVPVTKESVMEYEIPINDPSNSINEESAMASEELVTEEEEIFWPPWSTSPTPKKPTTISSGSERQRPIPAHEDPSTLYILPIIISGNDSDEYKGE